MESGQWASGVNGRPDRRYFLTSPARLKKCPKGHFGGVEGRQYTRKSGGVQNDNSHCARQLSDSPYIHHLSSGHRPSLSSSLLARREATSQRACSCPKASTHRGKTTKSTICEPAKGCMASLRSFLRPSPSGAHLVRFGKPPPTPRPPDAAKSVSACRELYIMAPACFRVPRSACTRLGTNAPAGHRVASHS